MSACDDAGGSDVATLSGDDGGSVTTTTLSREESGLKFTQCMRDHGVEVDDPDADGRIAIGGFANGPDDPQAEKMMEAQKACEKYLAAGGPKGAKGVPPEEQDKLLEQAQCLRDRGYDAKDPTFSDDGRVTMESPSDVDVGDEQFRTDQRECAEAAGLDVPGGGPGGPPGASVGDSGGSTDELGEAEDSGGPTLSLQVGGDE